MIRVRVDDFPQTKGEPQHTLDAFRAFHRCLSEAIGGRRYLLGVIPGRCTVEDLLCLRNETDVMVGMHGTDHDEVRLGRNGGNQFEPYLTVQDVTRTLHENRLALESALGRPVGTYMPPRNVIDWRTVTALTSAGFGWFTTGPETHPQFLLLPNRIHSSRQHEYGRTDEMHRHGQEQFLIRDGTEGNIILALHWTWETNIGLEHMRRYLALVPKELWADFDG